MRTFAFIPGQLTKAYAGVFNKYKRYDDVFELLKI